MYRPTADSLVFRTFFYFGNVLQFEKIKVAKSDVLYENRMPDVTLPSKMITNIKGGIYINEYTVSIYTIGHMEAVWMVKQYDIVM